MFYPAASCGGKSVLVRQLRGPHLSTWPWCSKRSSMALTAAASPDPRAPARDRKRMLRLLIEDVTLVKNQKIHIHIRWKAGATTSMERPLPLSAPDLVRTPADIVELVRVLATEQTDAQIARTLNARWLRTGRQQSFTRLIVRHIRNT